MNDYSYTTMFSYGLLTGSCIASMLAISIDSWRSRRTRPKPTPPLKSQISNPSYLLAAVLYGGPLDGTEIDVPQEVTVIRVLPCSDSALTEPSGPPIFYQRQPHSCPKSARWVFKHTIP